MPATPGPWIGGLPTCKRQHWRPGVSNANVDLSQRVAATANRLRLVQIDFADETQDVRRDQLCEEVERAMAGLVPDQRQAFLEQLAERFPSWDSNVVVAPVAAEAPARSQMDQRELKDPSFLVTRLIELAPSMTAEQKLALGEKLRGAGFVTEGIGGWPAAAAEALANELSPGEKVRLDPVRTLELLAVLVAVSKSLDQLAWNTWKTMAPRSAIRRGTELNREMVRFVAGDPDYSRTQVKQDVERLRQLIAALISAVGKAGGQFAQKHLTRFSPNEIEMAVGKAGIFGGQDAKCWQRYKELFGATDAASIESELLSSIVNWAEPLIKGLAR
jgi:hypothetical protein